MDRELRIRASLIHLLCAVLVLCAGIAGGRCQVVSAAAAWSELRQYEKGWTEAQIIEETNKRRDYYERCPFVGKVVTFREQQGILDTSGTLRPLFKTDQKVYDADTFAGVPPLIINLARNEIYARHGYVFRDDDLRNYFLGQLWYLPTVPADEFDSSVFNDCERANLELLVKLDVE